eukprot:sb/3466392/
MSDSSDDELGLFSFSNKKKILKESGPVAPIPQPGDHEQEHGKIEELLKRKNKRKRLEPVENPVVSADTVAAILEEDDEDPCQEEDVNLIPRVQDETNLYDVDKLCAVEPVNEDSPNPKKRRMTKTVKKRNQLLSKLDGMIGKLTATTGDLLDTSIEDPSADSSPAAERSITLKFRKSSNMHRFKVFMSTPLNVPLGHIAGMYDTVPSQLLLQLNDENLDHDKSSRELGITVADIIEVLVVGESKSASTTDPDDTSSLARQLPGTLTIKIQSTGHRNNVKEIKVFKNKKLAEYLFAVTKEFGYGAAKFRFDGDSVDPKKTPGELEIEDGDCLDILEVDVSQK